MNKSLAALTSTKKCFRMNPGGVEGLAENYQTKS